VRRCNAHTRSAITVGELVVDLDTKTASACGTALPLTTKEYQMLEVLCLRRGMTLSKDALLNHLYGGMDEPDQKIIDVFICKLRKKIAAAAGHPYIQTVWGRGYQVVEPGAVAQAA
jgi:two-component system cell cycle response regulator CtrA